MISLLIQSDYLTRPSIGASAESLFNDLLH